MIKVKPIKDLEKVAEIQRDLERMTDWHWRRIYLLFMTGIYTGLRISDIVGLRVKNVKGQYILLTEVKTEKDSSIIIPNNLRAVYDDRLAGMPDDAYLFPSRMHNRDGSERHIITRTAENDMKLVKERYNIPYEFNCHSLRKTFGYRYYKKTGDVEGLRKRFNHATVLVTERYIDIDEEEVNSKIRDISFGFLPPKPEGRAAPRETYGEPVRIRRADHTKQGKIWGKKQVEKRRKQHRGQDPDQQPG